MASKEQLRKVALYCSEYDAQAGGVKTCEKCGHFTEDGLCDIDLVDEILTNMAMELDKK